VRVLAVTNPAEGHFFPMVPFLWALRAAGHEVLVGAPENFLPEITAAGLSAVATAPPMDMTAVMRPDAGDDPPRQPPTERAARQGTGQGFGRLAALTHTGVAELGAAWRPDVIVSETSAYAAAIAAARIDCPHVEFHWGIPLHPDVRQAAFHFLASQGLQPGPRWRSIGVCPPSFLRDRLIAPDWAMKYVAYNGAARVPPHLLTRSGRRRVLVTLGTMLPRYGDVGTLVTDIVASLVERDLDVVVGMRGSDRAKLGDPTRLPLAVREAVWTPLSAIVGTCAAVVHHGGSGTTMTSLSFGVPQVAIPHFADQFVNAEHLVASGCGVQASSTTPGREIARLVELVLNSPCYADRASSIARDCHAQAAPTEVASLLERSLMKGLSGV
jgi:L-noviosyl transferase